MTAIKRLLFLITFLFVGYNISFGQTTPTLSGDIYQISSLNELIWIQQNASSWSGTMVLTNDIDISLLVGLKSFWS